MVKIFAQKVKKFAHQVKIFALVVKLFYHRKGLLKVRFGTPLFR